MDDHPTLSQARFERYRSEGCTHIPLATALPAGRHAASALYAPLADQPGSYLLESGETDTHAGRYSIIGLPTAVELIYQDGLFRVVEGGETKRSQETSDPLPCVEDYLHSHKVAPLSEDLRFGGGLVGYFGYDLIRTIEPVLAGGRPEDQLGLPDMWLLQSTELIMLDNQTGKILLIVNQPVDVPDAYVAGCRRLEELRDQIEETPEPEPLTETPDRESSFTSEFTEAGFCEAVRTAREYIIAGDLMQVVLSQRLSRPFESDPFHMYRGLHALNPSPYMYFLNLGPVQVIGSSPEILVRREGDTVTVRPIAGTRWRGTTEEEDLKLEAELLADPKERAEHLMLIDLGRNDIGRVCQPGTVRLTEQMEIERYSHVMHIVSNVEGKLTPGTSTQDVLRATFPAGTVSGAPKIRAMEIIDELEPASRGIYSGAVGYFGWDGNLDTAIAIRTAIVHNGQIHVQAGAGIVYDSIPEREWHETMHKAQALLQVADRYC
ncbi:MAG: anthranilate synthase component I [Gammaproteobacteria bacterium]|nr:anthranilate synthase component I [Gammaproteobacteria bacterium]